MLKGCIPQEGTGIESHCISMATPMLRNNPFQKKYKTWIPTYKIEIGIVLQEFRVGSLFPGPFSNPILLGASLSLSAAREHHQPIKWVTGKYQPL